MRRFLQNLRPSVPLLVFSLIAIAATWGVSIAMLYSEHRDRMEEIQANSRFFAKIYEGETGRIIEEIDQATRYLKHDLEVGAPARSAQAILDESVVKLPPGGFLICVTDRHGNVIASSEPTPDLNLADRAHFTVHQRANTDDLYVGAPVIGRISHRPSLQFSRRLNTSAGAFAGTVLISGDPLHLATFYDPLLLGKQGSLAILGSDWQFRVRRVGDQITFGDTLDGEALRRSLVNSPAGTFESSSLFDAVRRVYSYRHFERYPFIAITGISVDDALAPYYAHMPVVLATAAITTLVILSFFTLMYRRTRELHESRLAAQQAQATFRAAAEGSLDAFYILEALRDAHGKIIDFVCRDLNARGAALVGRTRESLLGIRLCEEFPSYRHPDYFDTYVRAVETGRVVAEELEVGNPQIRAAWIQRQIVPLENGIALTSRDVTERKSAELEQRYNRAFLQSLVDNLPHLVFVKSLKADSYGKILVWNHAGAVATGYPASEVIGRTNREVFPAPVADMLDEFDRQLLDRNPMILTLPEVAFARIDGVVRYQRRVHIPIFEGDDTQPAYILGIAEDITERRAQDLALREKTAELEAVNDASPLGLFRADLEGTCIYVNQAFERMTGTRREVALAGPWYEAIRFEDAAHARLEWNRATAQRRVYAGTLRFRHADGHLAWASVKASPIVLDCQARAYVGTIDDITVLREANLALRQSESRIRTIADTLPMLVAYVDDAQCFRFVNRAYEAQFGRDRASIIGLSIVELEGKDAYARYAPHIEQALGGEAVVFEDEFSNGAHYECRQISYIPQRDDELGKVVGFHLIAQDITQVKLSERRLRRMAEVDPLTKLMNRTGFEHRLDEALQETRSSRALMALLYIDIDRFKHVNDSIGHLGGDALLRQFGERLRASCRDTDSMARLGGDEFSVIVPKVGKPEHAVAIASKIVLATRAPFIVEGQEVYATASVGIALYDGDARSGKDILRAADEMLYQAKGAGRNRLAISGHVLALDTEIDTRAP